MKPSKCTTLEPHSLLDIGLRPKSDSTRVLELANEWFCQMKEGHTLL